MVDWTGIRRDGKMIALTKGHTGQEVVASMIPYMLKEHNIEEECVACFLIRHAI